MSKCRKCAWAYRVAKLGWLDLLVAYQALPGWKHFHKISGKFVFLENGK